MSLPKYVANILAPEEDAKKQCVQSRECHRINGHTGECKTVQAVLSEKALEGARSWARRIRARAGVE